VISSEELMKRKRFLKLKSKKANKPTLTIAKPFELRTSQRIKTEISEMFENNGSS